MVTGAPWLSDKTASIRDTKFSFAQAKPRWTITYSNDNILMNSYWEIPCKKTGCLRLLRLHLIDESSLTHRYIFWRRLSTSLWCTTYTSFWKLWNADRSEFTLIDARGKFMRQQIYCHGGRRVASWFCGVRRKNIAPLNIRRVLFWIVWMDFFTYSGK